jgi:hypothetical protein
MYLKMHFDVYPTVVPFEAGDVQVGYVEGLVLPLQEMELAERFLDMPNMENKGINYKTRNVRTWDDKFRGLTLKVTRAAATV